MKIERNSPVRGARSVAQTAYARRIEAAESSASVDAVAPSASVLGIPDSEFTPRVRDAIMGLMGEVDSLRRELSQTRMRLDEVENLILALERAKVLTGAEATQLHIAYYHEK